MSKTAKKELTHADPDIAFSSADIAAIQNMAVQKAKDGDMRAATLVERMWRRRRRTVTLDLPPVDDASGLAKAQAAVIAAAAAGQITPREGMAFAAMLDYRRRALDTVEFEERLREVEKANEERERRKDEEDDEDDEEREIADARKETAGPPPSGQAKVGTAPLPQPGGDPDGPRRPAPAMGIEGPGTSGSGNEDCGRSENDDSGPSARAHRDTG